MPLFNPLSSTLIKYLFDSFIHSLYPSGMFLATAIARHRAISYTVVYHHIVTYPTPLSFPFFHFPYSFLSLSLLVPGKLTLF